MPPPTAPDDPSRSPRRPLSPDDLAQHVGRFVRHYTGPPGVADESDRTAIREDAVIQEVGRLLAERPGGVVRVLDACCGYGTLARHLLTGLGAEAAGRVEYFALDASGSCVNRVRKQTEVTAAFARFECRLRDAWDCPQEWAGSVHMIVLTNALHELPPHRFPELFDGFNRLLVPDHGRVCVVDMEDLPAGEPEAVAINWTRGEAEQFFRAGGFQATVTAHPKSVGVFQALVRQTANRVKVPEMLGELTRLLRAKLKAAVGIRTGLDEGFHSDAELLIRWVVLTGTIARLAEELLAVEARIAELKPVPSPPPTPAG